MILKRKCLCQSQSRSRTLSDAKYITSKLNLVDLAGSERLGKTGVSLRLWLHFNPWKTCWIRQFPCVMLQSCIILQVWLVAMFELLFSFLLFASLFVMPHHFFSNSFCPPVLPVRGSDVKGNHVHQQVLVVPGTGHPGSGRPSQRPCPFQTNQANTCP